MRILLAEDERDLNRIITKKLTDEGYSVDSCFDGAQALDYLSAAEYDGVILDIMMPQVNGLEVLSKLRAYGNHVPVLFLTARDSISDRVKGLDMGANDYLIKPFSFEELSARIRAMTRKSFGHSSNVLCVDTLELDTTGVEPMSHVFPVNNVMREDVVTNGDGSEATLANAPECNESGFIVPKTVES